MPAVWHAFAYVGFQPSDAEAHDMSVAVPPLRSRDRLRKPVVLREASYTELGPVKDWLSNKAETYRHMLLQPSPEGEARMWEAVAFAVGRLKTGKDVVWGHRLAGGRYLALAVIAEWELGGEPEWLRRKN